MTPTTGQPKPTSDSPYPRQIKPSPDELALSGKRAALVSLSCNGLALALPFLAIAAETIFVNEVMKNLFFVFLAFCGLIVVAYVKGFQGKRLGNKLAIASLWIALLLTLTVGPYLLLLALFLPP